MVMTSLPVKKQKESMILEMVSVETQMLEQYIRQ
jgi:hypothetical protein